MLCGIMFIKLAHQVYCVSLSRGSSVFTSGSLPPIKSVYDVSTTKVVVSYKEFVTDKGFCITQIDGLW